MKTSSVDLGPGDLELLSSNRLRSMVEKQIKPCVQSLHIASGQAGNYWSSITWYVRVCDSIQNVKVEGDE